MKFLEPGDKLPPAGVAPPDAPLAIGGDLSVERLMEAYRNGIFPWYSENDPVLWWSPDPRMVLFPENLKISKSMRSLLRKHPFQVTYDRAFKEVVSNCALVPRSGQEGTWITTEMEEAYLELHRLGPAKSVEVWEDGELVGGLYGIYLKECGIFCGESMFSKKSNASKYGFINLVQKLRNEGVRLIDCQIYTEHLERLGAHEIPRVEFLRYLRTDQQEQQ